MATLKPFWRRTPPALFPSLLGLFGLALAWRAAARIWDVPEGIGIWLGLIATLIFLVTLSSYVVKICIRPRVLWEDLKIGPARGSVSAGSMCAMALAAYLVPFTLFGAFLVWWLSIALHLVYFICVLIMLVRHPRRLEEVSPVLMLPFVGILVSTLAAPALGYQTFAIVVFIFTIPVSAVLLLLSLLNARTLGTPPPQRSSFAIFLAPPSVAAIGIFGVFGTAYYMPFWIGASLVGLALAPFWRWMSQGGWTPAWGAFTFPLAAISGVQILAVQAGYGMVAEVMAAVTLALASLLIPYIVAKTYLSWFQGKLAVATNAAVA